MKSNNCGIEFGDSLFLNNSEVINGNPLICPEVKSSEINIQYSAYKSIKLQSINLNKIHKLEDKAKLFQLRDTLKYHRVIWSFGSIRYLHLGYP